MPNLYAASHVSASYVWFRMLKSFWHDTGSGHPSRSAVLQSMVIPNAVSLLTPQWRINPSSKSFMMDLIVRSKSSWVPRSCQPMGLFFIFPFSSAGRKVGVDMSGPSLEGQWIWYRSMYPQFMRSMDLRQDHTHISSSYPCVFFARVGCSLPTPPGLILVAMYTLERSTVPSAVRFVSQLPIHFSVSAPYFHATGYSSAVSMKFTPSSITSLSSCSCAWDSSALKEPHVMVPAQTCVTVMSVRPNLTFFRVVLRFTVAILSCGAVVDETFSVRERSDVASRFANTFSEKKGGRKTSEWHVARPPRSITVCCVVNV